MQPQLDVYERRYTWLQQAWFQAPSHLRLSASIRGSTRERSALRALKADGPAGNAYKCMDGSPDRNKLLATGLVMRSDQGRETSAAVH